MDINILRTLSYGMYAIGVKDSNNKPSACIANTVFQITVSPTTVAVSINHDNYSRKCITENKIFSVSVLSEETSGITIGTLGFKSGRDENKLQSIPYRLSNNGLPIIEDKSCCWFECKVIGSIETPTHTLFLGEIINGCDTYVGTPMTYSYYHTVIKGSAPKAAPTYQPPKSVAKKDDEYICTICGYVYDNSNGSFDDLPDDWVCPICGAPKSVFKKKEEEVYV